MIFLENGRLKFLDFEQNVIDPSSLNENEALKYLQIYSFLFSQESGLDFQLNRKLKTSFKPSENSTKFMLKIKNFEKAIFYGGSFYPWHKGHLQCVLQASNYSDWPIIVVPDCNPWKEGLRKRTYRENLSEFIKICYELLQTSASIFPGFWSLKDSNPTSQWLPYIELKQKAILLGDDSFLSFEKWKNYSKIINSLDKIIVVARHSTKDEVFKVFSRIQKTGLDFIYLEDNPYKNLSSTLLR